MTNYFIFFLMDKFEISVQGAQYCLFTFLGASAVRHGRRRAAGRPFRA